MVASSSNSMPACPGLEPLQPGARDRRGKGRRNRPAVDHEHEQRHRWSDQHRRHRRPLESARYPTRLHLVPERAPLAQRVATLLSLTLLSARVCGPDSIQVIAPPSTSHATQMAISPTIRTPLAPPSPALAKSAVWFISARPATHEPAQPATRSQLRGRQPRSRTNPATSSGPDSSAHTGNATTALAAPIARPNAHICTRCTR